MRIVDEETRRVVQKNRLDALEGDHLFDELNYGDVQMGDGEGMEGAGQDEQDEWAEDDEESDVPSDDDDISSSGPEEGKGDYLKDD